ncbi:hypothetical protein BLA13014_03500 [Burkholderia aenigmatica]|uniref:Uncharacterized protein n=1 Tax=Burkholderia aenigmatica TaxID=2015348 RepID=A0A6P2M9H4_9BURK|nr:hypothetical protein BLA13014_03500 [Burkholderia aenigmatica]
MLVWRRKRRKLQMLPMHSLRPMHPMPDRQAPQDARVMRQVRASPPTHPATHAPTNRDAHGTPPMPATRLMRMT